MLNKESNSKKESSANPFWHAMTLPEIGEQLGVDESGLSKQDINSRIQQYGPNVIPKVKKHGPFFRFLLQFHRFWKKFVIKIHLQQILQSQFPLIPG